MRAETICKAFFENWVADRGCPLTITTDQGTQFESQLFSALASLVGTNRIRTTPYHPQSNGMVERFHRTLKAALMCSQQPWPDALPTVLLGLRASFKENLQVSPWEMVYGTTPRLPGDFFMTPSREADPFSFVDKLRILMSALRPVPAADHAVHRPYAIRGLDTCTHVFQRIDGIRKPLVPPYAGPFPVVRRISPKVYVILVNGAEKTVSTDALKPAYLEQADVEQAGRGTEQPRSSASQAPLMFKQPVAQPVPNEPPTREDTPPQPPT